MPVVTGGLERVVQPPHQLRRFDIDRRLIAEVALLHAHDEAEPVHMLRQFRKGETHFLPRVAVQQFKSLEVAQ